MSHLDKLTNLFHSSHRCMLTDTIKTIDLVSLHCDKTCCMAASPFDNTCAHDPFGQDDGWWTSLVLDWYPFFAQGDEHEID